MARVALAPLIAALGILVLAGVAHAAPRPNIIVVQTDDQDAASLTRRVIPETVDLLKDHGTTFTDYIDSGPLCCPSRAVLLTGQYGHNNGVLWDNPNPYGDLREKGNTLPVWLHRAGYRTAHVGKYLNLYARAVGNPNEVPPGWDEWHTVLEPFGYYDYTLRENGRVTKYGDRPQDYLTRVLNHKAESMIHQYVPRRRPLFMEVDQFAPHGSRTPRAPECDRSGIPDPRDRGLFAHASLPRPPSFDEADVSDKPSYIRAQPRFTRADIASQRRQYQCRLASLRAVDRGIAGIVQSLRAEHELDDTAIIFTSDNGWLQGQHRVPGRKVDPYEEGLHVPFVMRLPTDMRRGRGGRQSLPTTVANIDVAPTILRIAGAKPCSSPGHCRILDGRSVLSAIRSDGRRWPPDRAILLELRSPFNRAGPFTPCDYQGIRTARQVYVDYHSWTGAEKGECTRTEEVEHYDLRSDPFELQNLFPAPAGTVRASQEQELAARLARLDDCAGIRGRDPRPASGHYCD